MNKYSKEIVLLLLVLLPYGYLGSIWNKLPDQVPTHFNINGQPDDYSPRSSLFYLPGALGIGIYVLMLIIPVIDPKKKIKEMGNKYFRLRFLLNLFMSILSVYLLYLSSSKNPKDINFLFTLMGALFALLGNYFQTVRPNYFVGIRTPWTLENEEVWRKTHRLGGRWWMAGGLMIVLVSIFTGNYMTTVVFTVVTIIISVVPIVYSYLEFQKIKKIKA